MSATSDPAGDQSRLLREALLARAQAEAAGVRADDAREEAERARADAEAARERIAMLANAGRRMAESMEIDATMRAVVASAVPVVADWCVLTMVEPSRRLRSAAVAHHAPDLEPVAWDLAKRYPPDPSAITGPAAVIRTGELETMADITPDTLRASARDEEHFRLLQALDLRQRAVAPLITPAGVIGALTFVRSAGRPAFSEEDLELVRGLAARAALNLQNARLYTERSHIARTLQASLRPRALPDIPGVDVAARFRPAGDQNEVGGDFYDVFLSGEGVWTAIVGDVSGKGAEAAAITAMARHTLRTASMLDDDPAANLALLNRAMEADSAADDFCTVFYARIRPGTGDIHVGFSNGGHPSPLLLRADGRVEEVDGGRGPLVGAVPGARFTGAELRLTRGDLLLLYTDGVTEVRTDDVDLGERELRATLAAHAGASAAEIVQAVEHRAVELQEGAPRDDIALVAIRAL